MRRFLKHIALAAALLLPVIGVGCGADAEKEDEMSGRLRSSGTLASDAIEHE
jgi:hypothetical protein